MWPGYRYFGWVVTPGLLLGLYGCENHGGLMGQGAPDFSTTTAGEIHTETGLDLRHTCGLSSSGAAFCWGDNSWGQLGTTDRASTRAPVAVHGGHVFQTIVAGRYYTCGTTRDGETYCWGACGLGGGFAPDPPHCSRTPVRIEGSHRFTGLSVGSSHACGLTAGKAVYCWGSNAGGQLGDGSFVSRRQPVRVAGTGGAGS